VEHNRLRGYLTYLSDYRFLASVAIWRDVVEIESYVTKRLQGVNNLCSVVNLLQQLPDMFGTVFKRDDGEHLFWDTLHKDIGLHGFYQRKEVATGKLLDATVLNGYDENYPKLKKMRSLLVEGLVRVSTEEMKPAADMLAFSRIYDNSRYDIKQISQEDDYFSKAADPIIERFSKGRKLPQWAYDAFPAQLVHLCMRLRQQSWLAKIHALRTILAVGGRST